MIKSSQNNPDRLLRRMSIALLLAYTFRVTLPSIWINPFIMNYSGFALLLITVSILFFSSKWSFYPPALVLVFMLIITLLFSDFFETAAIMFLLWLLIFCATAPLIRSLKADLFRLYLWQDHKSIIYIVTVLSFVWYILKLPMIGKGISGVTAHCMLLSAIAGVSAIFSFSSILFNKKSVLYWGIFISSILTCLLSSSRAALAATVVGCAVAACIQVKNIKNLVFSMTICLLMLIALGGLFLGNDPSNPFTEGLLEKGENNSREELWTNRMDEFNKHMLTGVGLGIDTLANNRDENDGKALEPGSSYLAVLSMTGLLGALGLLILFFNLTYRFFKNAAFIPIQDFTECLAIGIFWFVHAVAEGWVFSAGALFCLFFWIWVGRFAFLGTKTRKNTGMRIFP